MLRIVLLSAAMAVASAAGTAAAAGRNFPEPVPGGAPELIVRPPARFPDDAPPDVNEGWVIVEFTVTGKGRVENARAVESSHEAFEEPALAAVKRYRYVPRERNGVAVRMDGVRTTVRFRRPGTEPPEPMTMPAELWARRTLLTLSSGHTVEVMPPQAEIERRVPRRGPDGKVKVVLDIIFGAHVAFDPSSVARGELGSMAREIMDRHLGTEIERLEEEKGAHCTFGTVRFISVKHREPGAEYILVLRHADIDFRRTPQDGWKEEH